MTDIKGYKPLTTEQVKWINYLKDKETNILEDINNMMGGKFGFEGQEFISANARWLSIAKTHFQEGFMAAVRAVTRPDGD